MERFGEVKRHYELLNSIGQVNNTTFFVDAVKGDVEGYTIFSKSGRASDLDVTTLWKYLKGLRKNKTNLRLL